MRSGGRTESMETALSHCPELSTLTLGLTSVLGSDGSTATPVSLGLLHATTHGGGGAQRGAGPRASVLLLRDAELGLERVPACGCASVGTRRFAGHRSVPEIHR